MNDTELLEEYERGNEQAFTTLEKRYARALGSVVARFVKDKDLIDDVIQETWICFLRYRKAEQVNMLAYLCKIARGAAAEIYRKRKMQFRARNSEEYQHFLESEFRLEIPKHNEKNLEELVKLTLNKMDGYYSQLLIYKYYKGYTHADIIKVFNADSRDTWVQVRRAKDQFIRIFERLNRE